MNKDKCPYSNKTSNKNEAHQYEEDNKYRELEEFLNGQLPEVAEHDVMALIDNDAEMREIADILLDLDDIQVFEELKESHNKHSKVSFEKIVLWLILLAVAAYTFLSDFILALYR